MKKIGYKIGTILLAFTVLFSILSIGIVRHYCGNEFFSNTIFSSDFDCGMQGMGTHTYQNFTSHQVHQKSYCHSVRIVINSNNVNQEAIHPLTLKPLNIAVIEESDYLSSLIVLKKQQVSFQDYSPPIIVQDIPVLVQSFRI
jgi:hypothetical protein